MAIRVQHINKVTGWGVRDRKAIQVVTTNFANFAENGLFTCPWRIDSHAAMGV